MTTQFLHEQIYRGDDAMKTLAQSRVTVCGAGHFELRVTAAVFAGKTRVAQQRLVYAAITELMSGETAPVHAIDKMEIRVS